MKQLIIILLFISACSSPRSEEGGAETVITNVNVINVRDGSIAKGMNVVIDSGKIVRVTGTLDNLSDTVNTIEGSGKFLLPGLAEMHAHIPSPEAGEAYIKDMLFLYLSNGVTTIRGMLGHPAHLELRRQAAAGELLSPRIFTSSPSFSGSTVQSKEEARNKVTTYQEQGYDFLKLHPGIPLEIFEEIVQTAEEAGIPFAGHVPVGVGIRRALESGYASIDHVDGFLEGLVPPGTGVDPEENGFFGYNFTPLADTGRIGDLVEMTNRYEVWVVPTQSLFSRWLSPGSAEQLARTPEMKYMPAATVEDWVNSKKNLTGDPGYDAEQWEDFMDIRRQLIYQLEKNGHGLLLGSDAPQVFNVPGFSIHHELQDMIAAGLSPLEAIRSGTLNPALFFGQEGAFGEITEGASADLLLVNGNPLEDIEALKDLEGVMVRGKWLSRQDIDARLEEIAKE